MNSHVTIRKKIGRKLGAFQRSCALRSAIAGRITVLLSVSFCNRLTDRKRKNCVQRYDNPR